MTATYKKSQPVVASRRAPGWEDCLQKSAPEVDGFTTAGAANAEENATRAMKAEVEAIILMWISGRLGQQVQ
jgi:hypothetical protein